MSRYICNNCGKSFSSSGVPRCPSCGSFRVSGNDAGDSESLFDIIKGWFS